MASSLPDKSAECVHEMLLKFDQSKSNVNNAFVCLTLSPFSDAADLLSDVALCLEVVAELNLLAKGSDLPLR
jgi:hypothetical protein